MSLICNGQLSIACKNCSHLNSINCNDLSFDEVEHEERSGGNETHHQAAIDITCAKCDQSIDGNYDVWEYPDGVINHESADINNGTSVHGCNISII